MTGSHGHPEWMTCPACGKRAYASRREARRAARTESLHGLSAYRCHQNPASWHIGHLPPGVTTGQYGRANLSRNDRRHQTRRREA